MIFWAVQFPEKLHVRETGTSSFFWNFQKCTCNFYATPLPTSPVLVSNTRANKWHTSGTQMACAFLEVPEKTGSSSFSDMQLFWKLGRPKNHDRISLPLHNGTIPSQLHVDVVGVVPFEALVLHALPCLFCAVGSTSLQLLTGCRHDTQTVDALAPDGVSY